MFYAIKQTSEVLTGLSKTTPARSSDCQWTILKIMHSDWITHRLDKDTPRKRTQMTLSTLFQLNLTTKSEEKGKPREI